MGERLTRAEAAKRQGVSRQRIDELINDGKLKEERATVDSDDLDALWAAMDPDYVARHRMGKAGKPVDPEAEKLGSLFNKAKTQKEVLRAQELELNLKIKRGQFVDKQQVTQQAFTVAKLVATRLQNLPRQLAPQVAVLLKAEECEEVIAREVARIISDMRDGLASFQ